MSEQLPREHYETAWANMLRSNDQKFKLIALIVNTKLPEENIVALRHQLRAMEMNFGVDLT